jgi:hypothetical protein
MIFFKSGLYLKVKLKPSNFFLFYFCQRMLINIQFSYFLNPECQKIALDFISKVKPNLQIFFYFILLMNVKH